jgi:subtilase family serine protease
LSDIVTNQGQGPPAASTTRYYLSVDAAWAVGDIALSGTRSVPALAAGASSAGSRSVTVPASMLPGTYYALACADNPTKLSETDEGNNCAATAGTILVTP